MVRDRWRTMWLLLGAASAFHVLVGGWSVLAAGVAWIWRGRGRPNLLSMIPALLAGLTLALPGLIPGVQLSLGTDAQIVAEANRVYVFERLAHHLVPHRFSELCIARHALLLAGWGALCAAAWKLELLRRLNGFVAGAVAIGAAGLAIDAAAYRHEPIAAALLRFYWFRLSDVALPLGVSLCACGLIAHWRETRRFAGDAALIAAMLLAVVGMGDVVYQRQTDLRPAADAQGLPPVEDVQLRRHMHEDWLAVCEWIRESTPPDAVFFTPRFQQTFKWYAQRSEVVTFKDVPQDARSLVEWQRRMQQVYPYYRDDDGRIKTGLAAHDDQQLARLAHRYRAQYVVIDRTRSRRRPGFALLYPNIVHENSTYAVYRIPAPLTAPASGGRSNATEPQ
jgi:hypothetical protein